MSIRKLFLLSNTEIIAKIFKSLPTETDCFCPCVEQRMVYFPFNVFDNGLAYEKFKTNFNFNHFSFNGNKILAEKFDDLIHVLVMRLGNETRLLFDTKDSGLKVIETIQKHIKPNNVFLKNFGIIGGKYPIINYEKTQNTEDSAVGFVIYRNLEAIEKAIAYQADRGYKDADKNYSDLIELARRKNRKRSKVFA